MNATPFTSAPRRYAAIVLAGAALLSACGSPATPSGGSKPTSIQQQSLISDQANPAVLGSASPGVKTQAPAPDGKLAPTGVRIGTHDSFDRVVIDLQGEGTPGWHVSYTDTATQQGSGSAVAVNGQAFLNVNIDGTTYPFELGLPNTPIEPVKGTGNVVSEVVSAGSFEGRSQLIIGVKGKDLPYSVTFLENPKRLVIDIKHS